MATTTEARIQDVTVVAPTLTPADWTVVAATLDGSAYRDDLAPAIRTSLDEAADRAAQRIHDNRVWVHMADWEWTICQDALAAYQTASRVKDGQGDDVVLPEAQRRFVYNPAPWE